MQLMTEPGGMLHIAYMEDSSSNLSLVCPTGPPAVRVQSIVNFYQFLLDWDRVNFRVH